MLGPLIPSDKVRNEHLGGISRWVESRMHERGELPARIKLGREWFYPENLLQEWLKSRLSHQSAK
jgi:predicted DNA-binding transcriptional regulator AlpA